MRGIAEPAVLAELRNRMISYVPDDMVMPRKRGERVWDSVKNEAVLNVPKERWPVKQEQIKRVPGGSVIVDLIDGSGGPGFV